MTAEAPPTCLDELARGTVATDQVFVAMWFGEEMAAGYEDAIEPAVRETGLSPMRNDRKEHDNKINDEIVAEIRRSRLVISDFTCGIVETDRGKVAVPRGGVYYEAGFAQGLGIPVWCVRHDQVDQVHFDTRQFGHIAWKNPEDLRRRLVNRIRARFADAGRPTSRPKASERLTSLRVRTSRRQCRPMGPSGRLHLRPNGQAT